MALDVDAGKHDVNPIAIDSAATLRSVGSKQTKRIPEKPREAFSRVLQHLIDAKYEGNQTLASKSLHVTQGHISAILRGERGPGLNMLLLMRLETGKTIDEMLGFESSPDADLSKRLVASVEMEVGRMRAESREMKKEIEAIRKQAAPASEPAAVKRHPRKRSANEK